MTGAPRLPEELRGRYAAVALLGQGSFGAVIAARDRELDRDVAIKVLLADVRDPETRARFDREARITAQLAHPGVVGVFDHGVTSRGAPFIVYELIAGPSLEARAEREPALELAEVARMGARLAHALGALHELGVLHRDVKPENVLLRDGTDPVLCDLGMARVAGGRTVQTMEGVVVGTPAFLAPELYRGREPSPASDQFSLAAALYQVGYRELPYGATAPAEVMGRLNAGWTPGVPEDAARRAPGLARVLTRALDPEPGRRFPDLPALAAALEAPGPVGPTVAVARPGASRAAGAGVGRPVEAGIPSSPGLAGAPRGPGRPLAGAVLVVVGILAAGAVLGTRAPPAPVPVESAPAREDPVARPLDDLVRFLGPDPGEPLAAAGFDRARRLADTVFPVKWARLTRAIASSFEDALARGDVEDIAVTSRRTLPVLEGVLRQVHALSNQAGDATVLKAVRIRWEGEGSKPGHLPEVMEALPRRRPELLEAGLALAEAVAGLGGEGRPLELDVFRLRLLAALYDDILDPRCTKRAREAIVAFDRRLVAEAPRGPDLLHAEGALVALLERGAREGVAECAPWVEVLGRSVRRLEGASAGLTRDQAGTLLARDFGVLGGLASRCPDLREDFAGTLRLLLSWFEGNRDALGEGALYQLAQGLRRGQPGHLTVEPIERQRIARLRQAFPLPERAPDRVR